MSKSSFEHACLVYSLYLKFIWDSVWQLELEAVEPRIACLSHNGAVGGQHILQELPISKLVLLSYLVLDDVAVNLVLGHFLRQAKQVSP